MIEPVLLTLRVKAPEPVVGAETVTPVAVFRLKTSPAGFTFTEPVWMVTAFTLLWLIEVTLEPIPPLIVIGADAVPATPPNTAVLAKEIEPMLLRS